VGRSPYQSEKRRKELARLKKQEEKRQRRFNKKHEGEKAPEEAGEGGPGGSAPQDGATEEPAARSQDEPEAGATEPSEDPGEAH